MEMFRVVYKEERVVKYVYSVCKEGDRTLFLTHDYDGWKWEDSELFDIWKH